jgi:hypothetical protein
MGVKAGDRIIVASEKAGKPPRQGEILEAVESPLGIRCRVHWVDEHESTNLDA